MNVYVATERVGDRERYVHRERERRRREREREREKERTRTLHFPSRSNISPSILMSNPHVHFEAYSWDSLDPQNL